MSTPRFLPSFALATVFTFSVGPAHLWAQADAAKPTPLNPTPLSRMRPSPLSQRQRRLPHRCPVLRVARHRRSTPI